MKTNRFQYFVGEGLKNIKRNRSMSIASIVTSFATLFMLGVFLVLTLNVNFFIDQIARGCQIQVFVQENATDEAYNAVGEKIKKIENVTKVEKYTKEQIFEEMRQKLTKQNGEDILVGFEEDNPYRDSFKINVKELKDSTKVVEKIKKVEGVAKVMEFQEVTQVVQSMGDTFRNGSLVAVLVLGLIAAFIISNSIKISVFSRRKEIYIMKYIGATNWFVRWPFLVEGIFIGIYGAIFAFIVMWGGYFALYTASDGLLLNTLELMSFRKMALPLAGAFVAAGMFIGFISSLIAIRKHVKV